LKTLCRFLLILLCLAGTLSSPSLALQASGPAGTDAQSAQPSTASTKQETGDDVYRHSASVKLLASWLHVSEETAAELFEYLNFAILAGAILFALWKYLPKTFRARRENIQHRLLDARTATEQAHERLVAIEQRLSRLDEEIAAISKQAEKDSVEDEARIKASLEAERQRIVEAVNKEIAAATSSAGRDLKRLIAGLAVARAAQKMVLTDDDDRALIDQFTEEFPSLEKETRDGGKN
jgi:F-type H+-transporting ATPase subunit b